MHRASTTRNIVAWLIVLSVGSSASAAVAQASGEAPGLSAFSSDAELRQFIRKSGGERYGPPVPAPPPVMQAAPPIPAMPSMAAPSMDAGVEDIVVVGARAVEPSITNNQVAGVDEGGIVKVHGDNLVILRRGRLFTVSTANGTLQTVDAINAFPKGVNGAGAWYDEMLVSQNRVIVVGYSYAGGGTEISRFRISAAGKLTHEDTYHLRSDDYYSSRNYASRLLGDTLVFYTPLYLGWERDPLEALPAMRRWRGSDRPAFKRIVSNRHVYITPELRKHGDEVDTLHAVTQCNMATAEMTCSATVVLGPASRSFYVSGDAVYLWVSDYWREPARSPEASLYRMPLDGGRPQAVQVRGTPLDQFSFHEDQESGFLNVAVRSGGGSDAMWRAEFSEGTLALLRLPLTSFGNGSKEASKWDYRLLPQIRHLARNRFVGNYLIYGGSDVGQEDGKEFGAVALANLETQETQTFNLPERVSRIEALGREALVVGSGEDMVLTTVALGDRPMLSDTFTMTGAAEGESRSHGFFFRSDSADGSAGVLGLAMRRPAADRPENEAPAWTPYRQRPVDMLFLRRGEGRLGGLGQLKSAADPHLDDGCVASCADWYGNARPIFLRGRVFALLGYELVEGREESAGIREIRRVNFAPAAPEH